MVFDKLAADGNESTMFAENVDYLGHVISEKGIFKEDES